MNVKWTSAMRSDLVKFHKAGNSFSVCADMINERYRTEFSRNACIGVHNRIMKTKHELPEGFVEHYIRICPVNPHCPDASGKWVYSAREDKWGGRCYRGKAWYYDTIEEAKLACIEEINRILEQRKKIKKNT